MTNASLKEKAVAPKALPKKYFSKFTKSLAPIPNLVKDQIESFKWLVEKGVKEVMAEFASIEDFSGKKFKFEFLDFELQEPKYDEYYAKEKKLSYEAPLKVRVRLTNKTLGTEKEQELFMTEFPMMTSHGTFIVSGIERVIVPQLARSFGVFFTKLEVKGKPLFGAKIIPSRGAWIEIETDADKAIYVRIDRKRKFPVTSLLRAFGASTDTEILDLFKDNAAAAEYIKKSLAKDHAKTPEESYVEIYRRLRDGDLVNPENAKEFFKSLFEAERYDLQKVGRFRFNSRFGLPTEGKAADRRTLNLEDVRLVVNQIITLNITPDSIEDDIDHLGSRRVRYVGELLQQKFRIGMAQIKRNMQNRMSTVDTDVTLPIQFIIPKPLQARLKEFFTTNQLSQFMSQENALAEIEHLRLLSALGPGGLNRSRAGFEVRDVHPSHYGRLCPIHTPEGPNIGLILHLALYARINEFGMIETPYIKVKNGVVGSEIEYLNALEEEQFAIAHAATPRDDSGHIKVDMVEARINGKPGMVAKKDVDYIDVATNQAFSIATSMIPFLNHDDANRALMGSNMQKQATPCVEPEAPLVATGIEGPAMRDTGRLILATEEGTVTKVDGGEIETMDAKSRKTTYKLVNFSKTNSATCFHQRPIVNVGDKVKRGDTLADTLTSVQGEMALGQNILIAFLSWSGANYEDAIILSERLIKENKFTTIHIDEVVVNVRDTKLGPEVTTCDIPNVGEAKLKNLAEDGVIRIGAEVAPGDILVGKITPKGESQLTPEERLLRSLFGEKARDIKDTSKRVEGGKKGRIINIQVFSREKGDKLESGILKRVHIEIAQIRNVSVGDKLAGRHGNKGVISKILPVEDMPYMKDGTPIDMVLTPLGVPSRMNLGQILELHLGLAAKTLGYQAVVPPFTGATNEEIKQELGKAGWNENGKVQLYDGRTGEAFKQETAVGYMYMLKLDHMVEDKIHMRSIGPYSLITQQPLGGKAQGGGQRFGEMEVWALLGHGAAYTLREMLTIKSDDIVGRSAAFDSIVKGERMGGENLPAAFNVLISNLRGLALDVQLLNKSGKIEPVRYAEVGDNQSHNQTRPVDFDLMKLSLASPEAIKSWSFGEVTKPETINYRTQRSERHGLFDEKIFGPDKDYECYCGKYKGIRYKGIVCEKCGVEITRSIVRRERMGHIDLCAPVSHIWLLKSMPSRIALVLGTTASEVEKVIYFAGYIITKVSNEEKQGILRDLDAEFKSRIKNLTDEKSKDELKESLIARKREIESIVEGKIVDEVAYHKYSRDYGTFFEAEIGAEAVYNIFKKLDLVKLEAKIKEELEKSKSVDSAKIAKRLSLIQTMIRSGARPEWMFLTRIPIIPPSMRPMVPLDGGRYATSDVNDLYRRVINRNNRLKKLKEISAPDVILRNEKRILQEAVDALVDNSIRHNNQNQTTSAANKARELKSLADNLKGKRGLFRQNLLGKRVDYSGRSVIVVGPELKLNQCGLPKHMALELFKPFVISSLLKQELAYNVRGATRLIDDKIPEVWAILEEVIKDRYVLLNRAPTLHRLGIQAFKPILIEGNAIQVHPLVCNAFNADFDGDQMAVHVPLSPEAQLEAEMIMASNKNILKPGSGDPTVSNKLLDIILGCFWMTKEVVGEKGEGMVFGGPNRAITAYDFGVVDFRAKIKVLGTDSPKYAAYKDELFETTIGRLLFNSVLPNDYPFINAEINKKKMSGIVDDLIQRYGIESIPNIMDKIKEFGFRFATVSGITWSIEDVIVPKNKYEIIDRAKASVALIQDQYDSGLLSHEEKRIKNIEKWTEAKDEVQKSMQESMDKTGPVFDLVKSEARGSIGQLTQMAGMKGLIVNTSGETIDFPIISSYKEGLTPIEYFITTHGARKGLSDTALNTAKAGYLTRKLFDVAQDSLVTEEDCGTKEGVILSKVTASGLEVAIGKISKGRFLAEDVKTEDGKVLFKRNHFLTRDDTTLLEAEGVGAITVRSPLTCKTLDGICVHCYGSDLGKNKVIEIGEAVGTVAAQAIGEPGTQLTMRTFHAGGTASVGGDITSGLPRVEEVFESRSPKNPAIVAKADGTVTEIRVEGKTKTIVVLPDEHSGKAKADTEYFVNYHRVVLVKVGDNVKKGDLMTDGSVDLDELFKYAGREKTQNYIIHEITKIYELQGEPVSRKHIEVIIKQMFSRRKIKTPGDTKFSQGDIVPQSDLLVENERVKALGKEEAKAEALLLGITEVSLSRKSFLSSASFQHTTRMLIQNALKGTEDELTGLKENVIIGRLIPAGSGFKGSEKFQMIKDLHDKMDREG